jgi:hypothetical protein
MRKNGKPKENVVRKREKGRPAIAADLLVALRLPIETRQAVLVWARDQPGQPNLSEAIRRLVDIGLGGVGAIPRKTPQGASGESDSAGKAAGAGPTALTPTAPERSPEGTTERPTVKGEQTTREVRWKPRIVEVTPSRAPGPPAITPEAQPATRPVEDDTPYEMPEDLKAFNAYWTRVEQRLRRRLSYEEVIVLFNQDRQTSKHLSDHER